jgi:hypothetical protein
MRASNFESPNASAVLDAKFQEYQATPWTPDPGNPAFRANCCSSFLSRVDTPLDRISFKGEEVYLTRWLFGPNRIKSSIRVMHGLHTGNTLLCRDSGKVAVSRRVLLPGYQVGKGL